jgi:hypothetical protein
MIFKAAAPDVDDGTIALNHCGVLGHPIGGGADLCQHFEATGIINCEIGVNGSPQPSASSWNRT